MRSTLKSSVNALCVIAIVSEPDALMIPMKSISPLIESRKPGWIVALSPLTKLIVTAWFSVLNAKVPSALKVSPSELPKLAPTCIWA